MWLIILVGLYEWKDGCIDKMIMWDLNILWNYVYCKGIKLIYYIWIFMDDDGEVGVNECESCVIQYFRFLGG